MNLAVDIVDGTGGQKDEGGSSSPRSSSPFKLAFQALPSHTIDPRSPRLNTETITRSRRTSHTDVRWASSRYDPPALISGTGPDDAC